MSLSSSLPPAGPNVVGATGGSGTRVVARILRRGGMYIGAKLNPAEDAFDLAEFFDAWINTFVLQRASGLLSNVEQMMSRELEVALVRHCAEIPTSGRPWGWKEPRSILLLPFLHRHMPALKFLHVVRDGRDLAFSANQNQLRKHGDALLGPPKGEAMSPVRAISLWSRVNVEAARYGQEQLGRSYLRIRFEDLCVEPAPIVARVLDSFELKGDPVEIAREVTPPDSIGRWRSHDPDVLRDVERAGREGLAAFGYVTAAGRNLPSRAPG